MFENAVVDRVQIVNVEGRINVQMVEGNVRVERHPGVVAEQRDRSALFAVRQLTENVIFFDLITDEIVREIDEGRQRAGRQRFQSLERRRRWIGDQTHQNGLRGVFFDQLSNERHLIQISFFPGRIARLNEIEAKGVDHHQNDLIEFVRFRRRKSSVRPLEKNTTSEKKSVEKKAEADEKEKMKNDERISHLETSISTERSGRTSSSNSRRWRFVIKRRKFIRRTKKFERIRAFVRR